MIEHVSLLCRDVERSRRFYERALRPLGYRVNMEFEDAVGFKEGGHTSFWIARGNPGEPTHLAFRAKDRAAVRAFYRAALAAGAKDNGGPGLRDGYGPNYYAAFVLDPDGHNMEAVTFRAPTKRAAVKRRARRQPSGRGARSGRARRSSP